MKELICTKCSTPLIPMEEYPYDYCPWCENESNYKVTTNKSEL